MGEVLYLVGTVVCFFIILGPAAPYPRRNFEAVALILSLIWPVNLPLFILSWVVDKLLKRFKK